MAFFNKKTSVVEELALTQNKPSVPVQSVPVQIDIDTEMKEEERKAYIQVCREIGFCPAAIIKDKILAFLVENHLKVYPYDKVKKYLDWQFNKKKNPHSGRDHTWSWCPLRETDRGKSDLTCQVENHVFPNPFNDNGEFEFNRTYHAAVPFAVLDLVKQLDKSVPGLLFFVSDAVRLEHRQSDPFMAVTTPGLAEMIVIAVWDEPNFGF